MWEGRQALFSDQPIHLPPTLGLAELLRQPRQQLTQLLLQPPRRIGNRQPGAVQAVRGVQRMHQQFHPQQLRRTGTGQILVEAPQGPLVEQYTGDPLERAVADLLRQGPVETRLRDVLLQHEQVLRAEEGRMGVLVTFLALLELLFSCLMFVGCTYYARNRGKELGLKIPKLKDDPIRTAKD